MVQKTAAEKKARDPIRLFTNNRSNISRQRTGAVPIRSNNQMKEVGNLMANLEDSLGKRSHWMFPWEGGNDEMHPGCDGINWYIRALH